MTFQERYKREDTWYGKVILMEVYHLAMSQRKPGWTVTNTAKDFDVSISLVSENLRLAEEFHKNPDLINCDSRQIALRKLG